jgi:D-alanyl-D-alanine carboxypeptidase
MRRRAIAVLVALWPVAAMGGPEAFCTAFDEMSGRAPAPGFAAGFVRGDAPGVELAAGVTRRGGAQPVGSPGPWHIGSIAKSFTATLIVQLAAAGQLDLDAPLPELLPGEAAGMHPDWSAVTLRGLLSHTAGMPANLPWRRLARSGGPGLRAARLAAMRQLWAQPVAGRPGRFVYSNTGYVLAGTVAEQVTGRSWEALIRTQIAAPLGLDSLGFGPPDGAAVPWGHRRVLGLTWAVSPDATWADNPAIIGPAGTLHLSLADLLAWGRAHLAACRGGRPDLIPAADCRAMQDPIAGPYALGWAVTDQPDGTRVVRHNGSNTLWFAMLAMVPARDLVFAYVQNAGGAAGDRTADRLLAALLAPDG